MLMQVAGTSIYYEERGSGETVVLIHAHSVDCTMWEEQFAELAERYHVVRYDLRGYGRSAMPQQGEDFFHVDDLVALIDKLQVKKAHFVGLSLGSMVALDMYGKHPDRVI